MLINGVYMSDVCPKTPEDVLSKTDPGDDMQRRIRYQNTYASIISLGLLNENSGINLVYCEHHEDILAKLNNGNFVGYQVKTKASGEPFKTNEKSILKSLVHFVEHEKNFPEIFSKYVIVSNCHFWDKSENTNNLPYVLQQAKLLNINQITNDCLIAPIIKKISKDANCTPEVVLSALKKTELDISAGIESIQSELVHSLANLKEMGSVKTINLEPTADALVNKMFYASSLSYRSPNKNFFSIQTDPAYEKEKEIIEGKRITKESILDIVNSCSTEALLRSKNHEPISDISNMDILRQKMRKGKISIETINHFEDCASSLEDLYFIWNYKYCINKANEYYDHLKMIAKTECLEAYDTFSNESKPYGKKMLNDVRSRIRKRHQDGSASIVICEYEHILGAVAILTQECTVWWSEKFKLHKRPQ
jgi:hypothetical protein